MVKVVIVPKKYVFLLNMKERDVEDEGNLRHNNEYGRINKRLDIFQQIDKELYAVYIEIALDNLHSNSHFNRMNDLIFSIKTARKSCYNINLLYIESCRA